MRLSQERAAMGRETRGAAASARWAAALALAVLFPGVSAAQAPAASVSGELKRWHKVTVTLDGPAASATGTPNPFLDLRMDVTFTHAASRTTYRVPGFFDADGDAANTSASAGTKWRAHLAPDKVGQWTYRISFRRRAGRGGGGLADRGHGARPVRRPHWLLHGRRDRQDGPRLPRKGHAPVHQPEPPPVRRQPASSS